MTFAETEAALTADLAPLQGVKRCLVRHMARAHCFYELCFERAEEARAGDQPAADLRLADRMIAIFSRSLGALDRRRAQAHEEAKIVREEQQSARLDHALNLAALANAVFVQKAKRVGVTPATAHSPGNVGAPPLTRQQRHAAARRLRKAGGSAQGP